MADHGTKREKLSVNVAFTVPIEMHAEWAEHARQAGFTSVALWSRAMVRKALNDPETEIAMERIKGLRKTISENTTKAVLQMFDSITAEDILGDG